MSSSVRGLTFGVRVASIDKRGGRFRGVRGTSAGVCSLGELLYGDFTIISPTINSNKLDVHPSGNIV